MGLGSLAGTQAAQAVQEYQNPESAYAAAQQQYNREVANYNNLKRQYDYRATNYARTFGTIYKDPDPEVASRRMMLMIGPEPKMPVAPVRPKPLASPNITSPPGANTSNTDTPNRRPAQTSKGGFFGQPQLSTQRETFLDPGSSRRGTFLGA